jgi:hypothetical protein
VSVLSLSSSTHSLTAAVVPWSPATVFRRQAAASYVRAHWGFPCSPAWLAKLATVGGGPAFRKAGRYPIYSQQDLDNWASSRIGPLLRSTSEIEVSR